MAQFLLQNSFKFGEISPKMFSRADSELFFNGSKRMRNVLVTPQGGAERRFGLEFIADFTAKENNSNNIRLAMFEHKDGSQYLFVFYPSKLAIYHQGSLVSTETMPYSASEISDIDFAQSADIFFVTHGNHKPVTIERTSAHAGWSVTTDPEFTHPPTAAFNQDIDDLTFNLYQQGTTNNIGSGDNKIGNTIDIKASSSIFDDDYIGGLFFGAAGTVRFSSRVSNDTMRGEIVKIFDPDSDAIHNSNPVPGNLVAIRETVFNANRGWPQKVTFFQNRLFFARTDAIPGGIWGSKFNGFTATTLNFDDSDTLDTNAISTILYGPKAVLIEHLVSYRSLVALTTQGVYSTSLLNDSPLTPTNIAFMNLQTADAAANVTPVVLENDLIFFDKGGRRVKGMTVAPRTNKYQSSTLSILSEHLIDQPSDAAVYQNSSTRDGNFLFVINSANDRDGECAVYQTSPELKVSSWTLLTTSGAFRHVASSGETVFFLVERTIDNSTVLYIEQLSFDRRTDAASHQTGLNGATTITGLSHLEGETVKVIGDGAILPDETVSSGQIELDTEVDEVEVGLSYNPTIVSLPLFIPTSKGKNIFRPKSITAAYIDFVDSLGITVNGDLLKDYDLGTYTLGSTPSPKTDVIEVMPMVGWDPRNEITVSQNDPLPFEIIGIALEVEA